MLHLAWRALLQSSKASVGAERLVGAAPYNGCVVVVLAVLPHIYAQHSLRDQV